MKFKFIILANVFMLMCCQIDKKSFIISPEIFIDNKITLSEIADSIKYIPLDNSIPIGLTYKLKLTDNYIYINAKDEGVLKFNRSGKLVCKIGKYGRGPEEYYYFTDFAVDEETDNIFVLDRKLIKIYSSSGSFLREINYSEYLTNLGGGIEILNSMIFIPDFIQYGNSKLNWVMLDTLGNLISKKLNSVPFFETNAVLPGQIYKFDNTIFYFNYLNDTIFSISSELDSKVAYLFSQGDHRFPKEPFNFDFTKLHDIFRPGKMFETKNYLFLEYSYKGQVAISITNKKTKKTYLSYTNNKNIESKISTRALMSNDIDGGMSLSTRPVIAYHVENDLEYISTLISPLALKAHIKTQEFINSVTPYPVNKLFLKRLADSLNETDNPILMIVRLKSK